MESLHSFILSIFGDIEDPRRKKSCEYPLEEILFIVFAAMLCEYSEWEDIADFGNAKIEWLRKYLPYENGVPSHDTINRTMSLLSTELLEKNLFNWKNKNLTLPNGTVINVDGKRLRRSVTAKQQQTKKVEGGKQAVQMFHAWSASLRLCLAQKQIQSKNNEISELPNLLDLLEISGCIITADSMNCQRATAEYIIDNEANYVLAVKDNQPSLVAAIKEVFQTAEQEQPQIESVKTVEKSHGRQETRICEVLPASVIAHKIDLSLWSGISCIVRTTSIRKAPYKSETQDYRYHISSLPINAIKLYEIIRGHWAIENQLHWVLDVCMGEDTSHKQQNNAAANISCIRKMIMNVLNSFDFSTLGFKQKLSLNRKRRIAALYEHVLDACIKQLLPDLVACCSHNDTT